MRILLLSSLTLALYAGPSDAQTYRTAARADVFEPGMTRPEAGESAPAAARLQTPDEPHARRPHARRAQQMARAFHASQDADDAPRPGAPLPLGEAIIVTETPQPDND
ncbi:MAG: hypothetical protein U9P68_04425 [Pseudomonadota bacterium]|nr:hypothetical protein [Pseudomonadota bacterium]